MGSYFLNYTVFLTSISILRLWPQVSVFITLSECKDSMYYFKNQSSLELDPGPSITTSQVCIHHSFWIKRLDVPFRWSQTEMNSVQDTIGDVEHWMILSTKACFARQLFSHFVDWNFVNVIAAQICVPIPFIDRILLVAWWCLLFSGYTDNSTLEKHISKCPVSSRHIVHQSM